MYNILYTHTPEPSWRQECANAVAAGTTVKELSMMVHTHPTLSEVLDEAFKGAVGMSAH